MKISERYTQQYETIAKNIVRRKTNYMKLHHNWPSYLTVITSQSDRQRELLSNFYY